MPDVDHDAAGNHQSHRDVGARQIYQEAIRQRKSESDVGTKDSIGN